MSEKRVAPPSPAPSHPKSEERGIGTQVPNTGQATPPTTKD